MRDSETAPLANVTASVADSQIFVSVSPAIAMIDDGNALEEQGRIAEAMARYEAAIRTDPRCARAYLNHGNMLLVAAKLEEARAAYQLAIACEPHYAAAHFNLGNVNYRINEFELALHNYQVAIDIRPDFVDAYVAMANALDNLGRTTEASECYKQALSINPDYAEVHFNLGMLAMAQGRSNDAVEGLLRAVEIKPDFSSAREALRIELSKLEDLDVAEASYFRALAIEPISEGILYDMTMILLRRGKATEALPLLMPALDKTPTFPIKVAFAECAARIRFTSNDLRVRAALKTAITEAWGTPYQLVRSALSLVMLDHRIARCVRVANLTWPAPLSSAALFGADGLIALAEDSLLHALLEAAPVGTIEFERFLSCARRALLETASENKQAPENAAALRFFAALSRQCFTNEYIFGCERIEQLAAAASRDKLLALMDANAVVPPLLLLAVATYFPLYTLHDANRLLNSNYVTAIDEVLRQQIREPLEELRLRAGIKCLTPITVGVSEGVRSQYEQNPYPRWVNQPKYENALHFNGELRRSVPFGSFMAMPDDSAPEALIAGCGTGSHSIFTSQRFLGVRVLAIDLSLSSISYAKRKTQELGVTNIEYAQADILNLNAIAQTFDIIESVGVLHHLSDPFAGWRTLLSLLRPEGFMRLGFYSELARRHVVKAREIIAASGYLSTPDDIRRFRQDLAVRKSGVELQGLSLFPDFFSTSECRDLLFHVEEHRLTLSQIESFLAEFGLHFIGFEVDSSVLHEYRKRYAEDPSGTQLGNWASFESDYPDTFAGMYQFWIQKPR